MALRLGARKKGIVQSRKRVVGQLRRAQLVTTFGCGAIVDMPDYSVMIAATDYWNAKSPVLHEANLERLLNTEGFRQPYISEEDDGDFRSGERNCDIPAFRFPVMHFCPKCKRLMPFWAFGDDEGRKCNRCNANIIPTRFVAACVNGHIEDFPYNWWVHYGDFTKCAAGLKGSNLQISFSDESGGLDSIVIKCSACGAMRSMAGSMKWDSLKGYRCQGRRPWLGLRHEHNDPEPCRAKLRGLHRGDTGVYFPQTISALTIPPWSTQLAQLVDKEWSKLSYGLSADASDGDFASAARFVFGQLLDSGRYTLEAVVNQLKCRAGIKVSEDYTEQNLYEDEYKVLCVGHYEDDDDMQFHIEEADVAACLQPFFAKVVQVKRLREILALRGFRRLIPDPPDEDNMEAFPGYNLQYDIVPLSSKPLGWYPAIEMLGEGIFIQLNEESLRRWENKNFGYYDTMLDNLRNSNVSCENFSARYVLLHTLSHLLIRQLTLECGYAGASIKERIYSSYPDSDINMAGILLYTSSSDADGSLGGLVRNALPENMSRIVSSMLQEASWCSSDPICSESKNQGYASLNYAACHACTLLPETSCVMRNSLLDRYAVAGNVFNRNGGFFKGISLP